MSNEYIGTRRICYDGGMQFVPVCSTCGRFVKADESVSFDPKGQPNLPNATCSKCGRTMMIFEGYFE